MPTYILRPNGDDKKEWTESTGTDAYALLDDVVTQPTAPTTSSDFVESATNAQICRQNHETFTLAAGEVVIQAKVWAYCKTETNQEIDWEFGPLAGGALASGTINPGTALGWQSLTYNGSISQGNLDILASHLQLQVNSTGPLAVANVGAVNSGTGAITPPHPASIATGDILISIAESVGGEAYTEPANWDHVPGSPLDVSATVSRLTAFWRRYDGTGSAPSLGDPGNHGVGRMVAIRGAYQDGDPFVPTPAWTTETTADTSAAWPGLTTTFANQLILECIATGRDLASTAILGALTNANYASIAERMDNWISDGTGGGIGMVSAFKTTAGATGSSTATLAQSDAKVLATLALKPAHTRVYATYIEVVTAITRTAAVDVTLGVSTSGVRVVDRSTALAATAAIATVGQCDLHRQTALTVASAIATAGQRDLLRQAAVSAATAVQTAGQRDLHRQVAAQVATATSTSGHRVVERSAALTTATAISTAGQRDLHRQSAVATALTVAVAGQRALHRQAAVQVAFSVATDAEEALDRSASLTTALLVDTGHERDLHRQTAVSTVLAIATSGEVEGSVNTVERAVSLTVATSIATSGTFFSTLERAAAVSVATAISSAALRVHVRSSALTVAFQVQTTAIRALLRAVSVATTFAVQTGHERDLLRAAALHVALQANVAAHDIVGQPGTVILTDGARYGLTCTDTGFSMASGESVHRAALTDSSLEGSLSDRAPTLELVEV